MNCSQQLDVLLSEIVRLTRLADGKDDVVSNVTNADSVCQVLCPGAPEASALLMRERQY
jgi:hypothetical protein